ncbi:hypothetical protein DFH09DRAFT_1287763 [Mycena vulgaris]|nr:hypothetical protein DFH09DRAFT_1287763 [Mycena vulgaris]
MISPSYHHHQNAPGSCPAPPTAFPPAFAFISTPDELTTHYQHLCSLLDSALATLTLINVTRGPVSPPWAPHVVRVTQALNYIITTQNQTSTSTSTSTPPTAGASTPAARDTHDDTSPPTLATYAVIADPHRKSPSPITLHNKHRPSRSVSTSPRGLETRHTPRVVLRFDLKPAHTPVQTSSAGLYLAVEEALSLTEPLSGIHWTQRGNLVLHPAPDICTAKFLLRHRTAIWAAICPLLELPDKCPCPPFEVDEPWHSVVFHGVPKPFLIETIDREGVEMWLRTGQKLTGGVKAVSILCRPEDLATKSSITVRVSLSSEEDALQLLQNGGCFYGTKCRVTRYTKTLCSPPRPSPSLC